MTENYQTMSIEKLISKRDQAFEMAGLARQDNDIKDAERHAKIALEIQKELAERIVE